MPEHAAHAMLAELGVGPEIRKKIIATIPDFEAVLQTDPYRISKEVEGVGFLTADALAQRAGAFQADSPKRLASGIQYALELGQQDGHTGLSYAQLLDKACEALTFGNRQALSAILAQEIKNGRSEEHTSELQSQMRNSYAVFCLKKKKKHLTINITTPLSITTTHKS